MITERQKQAIRVLNNLLSSGALDENNYFLLMEYIINDEHITYLPFQNVPTLKCYDPEGTCTNPQHDCIGCPKTSGTGTWTSAGIDLSEK